MKQTPRSGSLATRLAPPAVAICRDLSLSDSAFLQHPDQHRSQGPILSQSMRSSARRGSTGRPRTRSGRLARSRQHQAVEQLGAGSRPEGAEAGSELLSTAPVREAGTQAPDGGMSRPSMHSTLHGLAT
jgi:hypothetical protein